MTSPSSTLPKLGFGCSGAWGMGWFSTKKAIALIHQSIEGGIAQFDTGNFYNNGMAEKRLGLALRDFPVEQRAALRISSKTGTQIGSNGRLFKDFSPDTIRRDVNTSLARLGIEALDILYLHGPNEHELATSLPILAELKHAGQIRAIGVCSHGPHLKHALAQEAIDVLMGTFNLLDLSHMATFQAAHAQGKRVAAIAPLAQGLYRKELLAPRSLPDLWYLARALGKNRTELARARKNAWLHEIDDWHAPELALAFACAAPFIDNVITTTTKPTHLDANIGTARRDMPQSLYDEILKKHAKTTTGT